jgi:salicylate hydroxylase
VSWILKAGLERGERLMRSSHFNIHRAPFQRVLAEAAAEAGVKILVNARVVSIDDSGKSPIAITKDGRIFEADLIIGADGTLLLSYS